MKNKQAWLVSTNPECFSSEEFSSKEEAIKHGAEELNLDDDSIFFVGRKTEYVIPMPPAREFFQSLVECDCDSLGDWSEFWERGWAKSNNDLTEKIDKKLSEIQDLIMKYHKPNFFLVTDVEEAHGE